MKRLVLCLFAVVTLVTPSFPIYRAGMSYIRKGSEGSQYKRYGRWELRCRYMGLNGVVNCLVLVADGAEGSNPSTGPWQEYDMEICGNNPDHIQTVLHINRTGGNSEFTTGRGGGFDAYEGFNLEFHTFACEWTPEYVTWEVDGEVYRKSERIDGRIHDFQWPVGEPDSEPKEVVHDYDWIEMWANDSLRCAFDAWECSGDLEGWCGLWEPVNDGSAIFYCFFRHYIYTPGEGPNGSNFTLEFSEDYDGTELDTTVWAPYGCELRGGFAIGSFGAPYTDELPEDLGDVSRTVSKESVGFNASLQPGFQSGVISYTLKSAGIVSLELYNMNGRLVRELENAYKTAGIHKVALNKNSIPSGSYVLNLKTYAGQFRNRVIIN
jgi:hypothetical protein